MKIKGQMFSNRVPASVLLLALEVQPLVGNHSVFIIEKYFFLSCYLVVS